MIIVLGLPGVAVAAKAPRPDLPDGFSGIQQYTESIPTAGGQRAAGTIHRSTGSADQGSVPASTQGQLLNDGPSGQQAASLAAATGPATPVRHAATGKHTGKATSGRTTTRHSSTPVPAAANPPGSSGGGGSSAGSAVAASLTGGVGATGFILPLVLAIVAVGALVVRVRRRPPAS
jgi:hypothetical protein